MEERAADIKLPANSDVALVLVLYNPSADDLHNVTQLSMRYEGVIVDNSDEDNFDGREVNRMEYIPLHGNHGIAEAQNVALRNILARGRAHYAVFFDQDSRYQEGYPLKIAAYFEQTASLLPNIAALGPTVITNDTEEEYRSAFHDDKYLTSDFIVRRDIISSGCCISTAVLNAVGLLDESLFIDFVDTEWCFRAQSKGYVVGVTPRVKIKHKVGLGEIHIGKHIVSIAAPYRYYYQYRNFLLLLSRGYVPLQFKINFGIKLLCRFFYLPFMIKNGRKSWQNMARGIADGIKATLSK